MSPVKQITRSMALVADSILFAAEHVALNPVANTQGRVMTARFFIQRLKLSGISERKEHQHETR